MQQWDPWASGAIDKLADLSIEIGLSPYGSSAAEIRSGFERDRGSLVAALRYLQSRSRVQARIAGRLAGRASGLLEAIRQSLGE